MRAAPGLIAPHGMVGLALVIWGISIGFAWVGIAAGLTFEALRLAVPTGSARVARWIAPVTRICALAMLVTLGYALATQGLPQSLYDWLRSMPVVMLPLAALQILAGRIPIATLVRALRPGAEVSEEEGDIEFTYALVALTLAAAGTGNGAQVWLYAAYVLMLGWALIARAPARRRLAGATLLAIAAAIGYGTHVGLAALQDVVDDWSSEFIAEMSAGKSDPFRERTRIGDLGKIKLSDRIVMRVAVEGARPVSLLLSENAFERYRSGEWQATRRAPQAVSQEAGRWILAPGTADSRLTIRRTFSGGEGLLPHPPATRVIDHLPALTMDVFPAGAVRVRGAPRFVAIGVDYDKGGETQAPTATDLEVPEILAPVLGRVLEAEGLRQPGPGDTLNALRAFFDAKFSYSLNLGDARQQRDGRTLGDFLTRERKGHCEYFATATVLLLRQAGIPARYVGGYSAQEYSQLEGAFIVRARHAHAWAVAYVDGRWVEVDTTPARWAEFEGQAARSFLAPLLDRISWLIDRIVAAWIDSAGIDVRTAGTWTAGALGIAVALWIAIRRLRARLTAPMPAARDEISAAWLELEGGVGAAGHPRAAQETARAWAQRLHRAAPGESWRETLVDLASAYYRARFDPLVPSPGRAEFLAAARAWRPPA